MADTVLEMRHITKRFSGVMALNDVNLCAKRGETLALLGENGAGKSTLMKILSGFYPEGSFDGEIWLEGKRVSFANTSQSEKSGISMIYQELNMHNELTVAENLFLGHWKKNRLGMIDWKALQRDACRYLDMVGLSFVQPAAKLLTLNPSQQQLVAIAKALAGNPRILVLDEPTAALSEEESDNLYAIIHRLNSEGITCLLISHKLDEVFTHSDRLIVMRDSCVISEHLTREVDVDNVITEMIGRELENYYPKQHVPLGEVLFEAKDVSVPYPYNRVKNIVEQVSFQVRRGEVFGLCGLVGSGRSELVNAVFGKLPLSSGSFLLEGKPYLPQDPRRAIRSGIGLVTEDRKADGLIGLLSIGENLTLSSMKELTNRFGIFHEEKEKQACGRYFEKLRIKANSMSVRVQTLSGGNQQKVVLGRCLMAHPRLLILDEPTRGIDIGAKNEIYKIMNSLVAEGYAIIMISSELPELLSMSDRLLLLANGKSLGVVSAGQYTEDEIMKLVTGARTLENIQED